LCSPSFYTHIPWVWFSIIHPHLPRSSLCPPSFWFAIQCPFLQHSQAIPNYVLQLWYNIWRSFSPLLKKTEYECFSTVSFWMYCIYIDGCGYSCHTEGKPYSSCSVTWHYPAC
jgi:hypothetical protein